MMMFCFDILTDDGLQQSRYSSYIAWAKAVGGKSNPKVENLCILYAYQVPSFGNRLSRRNAYNPDCNFGPSTKNI
jgi:hypothetical protein